MGSFHKLGRWTVVTDWEHVDGIKFSQTSEQWVVTVVAVVVGVTNITVTTVVTTGFQLCWMWTRMGLAAVVTVKRVVMIVTVVTVVTTYSQLECRWTRMELAASTSLSSSLWWVLRWKLGASLVQLWEAIPEKNKRRPIECLQTHQNFFLAKCFNNYFFNIHEQYFFFSRLFTQHFSDIVKLCDFTVKHF